MNGGTARVALRRALEISRELANIADSGDVQLTQPLDAERLQLLKLARGSAQRLEDGDRRLLQEITELNDRAIGFLEHRRRLKARDLDMISVGRRAVRAYSATRLRG
jgi:hypothetical protein